MEDLNKHQLILLVLLVSFVTSIGTGIITVSLLQEAPPVVTSTVNRVVEKTIETVVQGPETPGKDKETVREVTVVVNQEDLVTESIEQNSKSIVRIYETGALGTEKFYGKGIVSGNNIISGRATPYDGSSNYRVLFEDGTETLVTRRPDGINNKIAVFRITDGGSYKSVSFGNVNALKLGQSLIVIGGTEQKVVTIGTLASLVKNTEDKLQELKISLEGGEDVLGAPVINLQGEVVGMRVSRTNADGTAGTMFIPVSSAEELISRAE